MDEQRLVQRIAAGDRRASREFVDAYLPVMLCAFRLCGVPEQEQQDLVQGFFAHLADGNYRRLCSWRGDSTLKTWLAVVAKNYARDWHRGRRCELPLDEDIYAAQADERAGPEELQWLRQQRQLINGILARALSERAVEILQRYYLKEQSFAEIAAELGTTVNNVRVAKSRALSELRQCLADNSPALEGF